MEKQTKPNVDVSGFVDAYLESDDFYAAMATPLKPAEQCKNEHRKQIHDTLSLDDFSKQLNRSVEIIMDRLPRQVTVNEWERIVDEFSHLEQNYQKNSAVEPIEGSIVTNQQLMGISDATLDAIYQLGRTLIDEKAFTDGIAIFHALCFFDPTPPDYWLGLGYCLYHMNDYEEALAIFDMAKTLNPESAAANVYIAFCHLRLSQLDQLQSDLIQIDEIFSHSPEEKTQWGNSVEQIKSKLKS